MGRAKTEWMEAEERGWTAPDKHVCDDCVDDEYLKDLIRGAAVEKTCDYCGRNATEDIAAPVEVILEPIADTMYYYFNEPTDAGVPWDGGWIFEPTYTEDALLSFPLDCHDDLFEDIANSFIDDAWVPAADGHWASSHENEVLHESWRSFVQLVKHEVRFFFGLITPSSIAGPQEFSPRHVLPAISRFVRELDLIKTISKGAGLHRVRLRDPGAIWVPDQKTMGAPPSELARAGRMNPPGISYLYLAFDQETAVAEVLHRPPSQVVIAKFELAVDISVLDLSNLPEMPSIFDSEHRREREGILFLRRFVDEISQPVRKDGQEHVDYVPSQVVCEYFAQAFHLEEEESARLSGIIYPSAVHEGGNNLVLFPTDRGIDRGFSSVNFVSASEVSIETWEDISRKIGL